MRARFVSSLFALAAACVALPAAAQSREATATELFDAGRDLMKAAHFADACPKLAASLALDPKVGTLARLAECEEHLGQLANAHAHWSRALSLAEGAHDARAKIIKGEVERIDKLVPKLIVQLGAPLLPGETVRIDGLDLGPSFGLPLPVDPGKHALAVGADGKTSWTMTLEVPPNAPAGVPGIQTVTVPALEDLPPPPLVPVVPPTIIVEEVPETPLRIPGVIAASVGAATVVGSLLVGELVARKDNDDSSTDGCSGAICTTARGQSERESAVTAGHVATGMFVAGAVLTGAGVTLALLPPLHKHASGTGSLRLKLGLGNVGFAGRFQ